ncbi:MAG: bifunctional diguanylate cyclase/phosphodiesterase [Rhodobacteraceae bacterium]|nr:bifunctional diguanylate cyclase/phosphodiesterase [Paracoccaceae bacterium]MBR9822816.1 bifunctional diguanylate cyclase/phosphodiesterase [Paracoccaceae bacterium]
MSLYDFQDLNNADAEGAESDIRRLSRALRNVALLAQQMADASAVVLFLGSERARQMDLRDCMIGQHEDVGALQVMSSNMLRAYSATDSHGGLPITGQPISVARIGKDRDRQAAARALFLKDGTCIGVLAFAMVEGGGADRASGIAASRLSQSLDLLGTTVEALLNDRLRQIELHQQLADSSARMQGLMRVSEGDPLTGLSNVAAFGKYSRRLLSDPAKPALLVLLDIDNFKSINDLYGHQFGDTYLRTVADAVRDCAPEGAVAGRLGGDEFGMVLALGPALQAESALRDLLTRCGNTILRATAMLNKPDLGRVSIGAARFPQDAREFDTLYGCADLALYASKAKGRGAALLFSEEIGNRYDYAALAKNLRAACDEGQVVPYFQPMVDLETGRPQVYEALCRWDNPRHGLMAPDSFESVFTDPELAHHLTRHMAREAFRVFGAARDRMDPGTKLSLNLTSFDLMDREFVFELQVLLSEHGMSWADLVVEVQETVVMGGDNGQIFRSLTELRHRGAEIALDDFGTGYGALKHLRTWPVDMLKIDRSFVQMICLNKRDRAIVGSILQLSQDLGFRVVAEGVESEEQAQLLFEMGCDLAQGFGFGRPKRAEHFLEDLGRRPAAIIGAGVAEPDAESPSLATFGVRDDVP